MVNVCYILLFYNFQDNTTLKGNDQYSFKSDHQELNINYLKQNDSGKYLCRATNRLGAIETHQQIRIKNISKLYTKIS
jgi:hypothetical protein